MIIKNFSAQRCKIFASISSLKDTQSKKLELINTIGDVNILFFQLGIKHGDCKDIDRVAVEVKPDQILDSMRETLAECGHRPYAVIKAKFGPKDLHYKHWAIEVNPKTRKYLVNWVDFMSAGPRVQ